MQTQVHKARSPAMNKAREAVFPFKANVNKLRFGYRNQTNCSEQQALRSSRHTKLEQRVDEVVATQQPAKKHTRRANCTCTWSKQ